MLVLVAATPWLLQQLARYRFTTYLRAEAAHLLALDAAGQSPYEWHFRGADDIVAGRVFGTREFSFDNDELRVRSEGTPFEVGLPLARPVSLQRFPLIHIAASADVPAMLQIVRRSTLDSPELAGSPMPMSGTGITVDLRTDATPADRAAMLRLRFALPAGHALRLHGASLRRAANAAPAQIRELPPGSIERELLEEREIHEESPAVIIAPAGGAAAALALAKAKESEHAAVEPNWISAGMLILVLLIVRLRPPRNARVRALVEIGLVLGVPMWLVVGGHFSGRVDPEQMALITATMLYAASLAWPRTWHWSGSAQAWLLASAVAGLALFIGFALHRAEAGLRPIGTGHVVRYLAWALMQQYLVCAVCLERWRTLTRADAISVYLSALCFALLHTPNSSLMLATFAGGLCWGALYLRERALLPLAFSHATSALLLIALLPPEILLSAEVSARFFQ